MISPTHFRQLIINPTLEYLGLYSKSASNLLLGTAVQESRLEYMKQLRGGPALGFYQIEPFTLTDLYNSYLDYRPAWLTKMNHYQGNDSRELAVVGNLRYATAVARMLYYRVPEKLPEDEDVPGLARYWKLYYNTREGRGTEKEFIDNFNKYNLGVV